MSGLTRLLSYFFLLHYLTLLPSETQNFMALGLKYLISLKTTRINNYSKRILYASFGRSFNYVSLNEN